MADKGINGSKASDRKGGQIVIIAFATIIIVLLVVVIILLAKGNINGSSNDAEKEPRRNVVVNPENAESVAEQMIEEGREYVEPGYFTVNMDTEWHFSKGDAVSEDAIVNNLAENTNDIYFDVFLADDESEAIYESPVIPLGGYLENIALDKPLDKGTYDCVIVYHLIDEDQNTISTLRVAFKIVVES